MSALIQHRVTGWLPQNHSILDTLLDRRIARCDSEPAPFLPVIHDFQKLIEGDAEIFMLFHQMFEQVPTKPPYNNDPTGKPQVRDYMCMLTLFNKIITEAPNFEENDFVGFPINVILNWPMGTPAGFTAFTNPKVNAQFKNMFDVWTSFLTSPESRYVLTTENDGWFGPAASIAMPNFVETFVSNPTAPFYGFTSWDDFFTRQFRPGVRPVEAADDNRIVNNTCESTVYCIAHDVKGHDKFWLKGQPYSLYHMLDDDALAHQFVGGTIYQAFLSAIKYHRWHSPVDGTVAKTVSIPGTYYAGSPAMVFPNPDPSAATESQAFLTAVATRALIFIQADNPSIGLMCFIAVGMAEVSTCEITVRQGQRLKKGDQMGMFHFGGSTHCLVFRPETKITFNPDYPVNAEVPLNVALATIDP